MTRVFFIAPLLMFWQVWAQATPIYTFSLEWPLDSAYRIDVRDQRESRPGITVTPVLQFDGHNRQTVVIVPALAACAAEQRRFYLDIKALQTAQAATLTVSAEQKVVYRQAVNESLRYELPELDKTNCQKTEDGMLGELTIAVAKPASGTTLSLVNLLNEDVGHAWIEFRALSSAAPLAYGTAGTYGSLVGNNAFNGINFFREIYRPVNSYKTVFINAQQWARLSELIDHYVAQGEAAWTPWHNCTQFAIDAWYSVTGEALSATRLYPNAPWEVTELKFPNTVSLYYSVLEHGGTAVSTTDVPLK